MLPSTDITRLARRPGIAGGLLALLLLCAGVLLGGGSGNAGRGFSPSTSTAEIPRLDASALPREGHRSSSLRWRHAGCGDDTGDLDSFALPTTWPQEAPAAPVRTRIAALDGNAAIAFLFHRPQAPRAPPLT
jgi:hypothetical protein